MSIETFLRDIPLPKMIRVTQRFRDAALQDVPQELSEQLRRPEIAMRVKKGMRIAVTVGSRGIDQPVPIVKTLVGQLEQLGAEPFIVPAMGSHGGATAEGQVALLAGLGVSEESVGCPILSSMDTVTLGALDNGLPVVMDSHAIRADGVVLLNRIKPHTGFSGEIESGLIKMLSIGLGKHKGAASCHALGYAHMCDNIVKMARIILAKANILFGVGTVENAYDKVARIVAIPATEIMEQEKQLLLEAKINMPRIFFSPLDVLVVDQMGKEYSGTGTDPSITGRANTPYVHVSQKTSRLVILDLSDKSKGNAAGIGLADVTTRRLFNKIDLEATYINHLTSTAISGAMIPMIMDNDRLAVQAALHTCNVIDPAMRRVVRIPNTLQLGTIHISESLRNEAESHPDIAIESEAEDWHFNA